MTRVLITGAGGVVGSAVAIALGHDYPGCLLVDRQNLGPGSPPHAAIAICELENLAAVQQLVDGARPEVVIHLAGNKDVFALQNDPELAMRANVATTKNLVRALNGTDTFVVFISTDYVFEGNAGPYRETSDTRPTTAYGKSKLMAEQCLRESGLPVAIARSAALFGFPNDFVEVVTTTLHAGKRFGAFADLVSNPTFVGDLAAMLRCVIESRLTGVFHLCGGESLSRESFARTIADAWDLDRALIVPQIRTESIRPPDLSLENTATCDALGYNPRSVLEILKNLRQAREVSFSASVR